MHSTNLSEAINRHCPDDGIMATKIPGLTLFRSSTSVPLFPVMYRPTLCLIGQGRKNVHYGNQVCSYDPRHFLISSVTMPIEAEILDAREDQPYLGLSLDIDSYQVGQLLIEMEQQFHSGLTQNEQIIQSVPVHNRLNDCFLRLLTCLNDEMDSKVSGAVHSEGNLLRGIEKSWR